MPVGALSKWQVLLRLMQQGAAEALNRDVVQQVPAPPLSSSERTAVAEAPNRDAESSEVRVCFLAHSSVR